MPRSLTEKLNGKDKVFEGQKLHRRCQLCRLGIPELTQNHIETRTLDGITRTKGVEDVELQIRPTTSSSGLLGTRLTLQMSDGREQDFLPASSDGIARPQAG